MHNYEWFFYNPGVLARFFNPETETSFDKSLHDFNSNTEIRKMRQSRKLRINNKHKEAN